MFSCRSLKGSATIHKEVTLDQLLSEYSVKPGRPLKLKYKPREKSRNISCRKRRPKPREVAGTQSKSGFLKKLGRFEDFKDFIEPETDTSIPSASEYFSYSPVNVAPRSTTASLHSRLKLRRGIAPASEKKLAAYLKLVLPHEVELVPKEPASRIPSAVIVCEDDFFHMYDIQKP